MQNPQQQSKIGWFFFFLSIFLAFKRSHISEHLEFSDSQWLSLMCGFTYMLIEIYRWKLVLLTHRHPYLTSLPRIKASVFLQGPGEGVYSGAQGTGWCGAHLAYVHDCTHMDTCRSLTSGRDLSSPAVSSYLGSVLFSLVRFSNQHEAKWHN